VRHPGAGLGELGHLPLDARNERGYLDLYDKPEMVHYCLGKLYDFSYQVCLRTLERIPERSSGMGGRGCL